MSGTTPATGGSGVLAPTTAERGDEEGTSAQHAQIARLERENAQLVERLIRLRQAVQGLVADVANARREAAALRRQHEDHPRRTGGSR